MRKNPEDTVKYNRQRYLKMKQDMETKKPQKPIVRGQIFYIGKVVCVEKTNHYYDFGFKSFMGVAPLIRIDKKAVEQWAWEREQKQKERRRKKK